MASGKSKSQENRNGIRRVVKGKELAPRSLRKKGKILLSDCTNGELNRVGITR